jgi:hypothetical protein
MNFKSSFKFILWLPESYSACTKQYKIDCNWLDNVTMDNTFHI